MKKILCIALAATIALACSGCAEKIFGNEYADGNYNTYHTTVDEFVASIPTDELGDNNPFQTKPTVQENDESDLGSITTYDYKVSDGIHVTFSANTDSKEMYQVVWMVNDKTDLTDETYTQAKKVRDALLKAMEPDDEIRQDVEDTLKMGNYEKDDSITNFSTSNNSEYTWAIRDDALMLSMTAKQK
jgi:hypothetical protein